MCPGSDAEMKSCSIVECPGKEYHVYLALIL